MIGPSDDDFRSYFDAARSGDAAEVKSFLGKYPTAIDDRTWFSDTTALREAAACGQRQIIELLLDAGADIDKDDTTNYKTPLMMAAMADRDSTILLLDRGAEIEAQDRLGQTVLTTIASLGRNDMVELLLDRGANLHAGNRHGFTPLRAAAYNGHTATVRLLLEHGAARDIDLKDGMQMTPLMWAASAGKMELVRLLLEHGATPDIKNDINDTAADIARKKGRKDIAALIREGVAKTGATAISTPPKPQETREEALAQLKQRAGHAFHLKPRPPQP